MTEQSDRLIWFGRYRLDRASGRLLQGDANVPLRLKTFAVLEYLATHAGRLVARDELLDAVWPETHVTPSVVAGCIRELRHALGDDARAARFVETAHRRGYRFIATPTSTDDAQTPRGLPSRGAPARDTELAALARRFAEAVAAVVGPSEHAPRERRAGHPRRRNPQRNRRRTGRR